jgi:hypothetical protein
MSLAPLSVADSTSVANWQKFEAETQEGMLTNVRGGLLKFYEDKM